MARTIDIYRLRFRNRYAVIVSRALAGSFVSESVAGLDGSFMLEVHIDGLKSESITVTLEDFVDPAWSPRLAFELSSNQVFGLGGGWHELRATVEGEAACVELRLKPLQP